MQQLYLPRLSPVHSLDARVRVLLTLAFILVLSLVPAGSWTVYVLCYALLLSAALVARIGPGLLHLRALLALPFVLAALPLLFSGPPPLLDLALPAGLRLPLSLPGLQRFAAIAARSFLSVQAAVLLAATTPFHELVAALGRLGLPPILTAIISLMGNYLHLIVEETQRMLRARSSRSAAAPGASRSSGSLAWRARTSGGMAGSLMLRSLERSERVYSAMLARGYNGTPPILERRSLTRHESLVLALGLAGLALVCLAALLPGA